MIILKKYPLKNYNTFGLAVNAENLVQVQSSNEVKQALKLRYQSVFVLGGGSNMLLTQDIKGLVLKNEIKGISIKKENEKFVVIEVGGGENWHQLVLWAIEKNLGGI